MSGVAKAIAEDLERAPKRRFWVALYYETRKDRSDWFYGGEDEARRRWPDADRYRDCTDMSDDEFQVFILNHRAGVPA